jgi:two-component system, chemotaxis family, protein-glutamate methylesterase/glutaminase
MEARDGQLIAPGAVYIAPGGKHMEFDARGRIRITLEAPLHQCRPSVDALFGSLARHGGSRVLAIILTGMGEDGAAGALALRQAGATIVAQDEASSIVFGMPRAAIAAGAAEQVLCLEDIKVLLVRAGQGTALS